MRILEVQGWIPSIGDISQPGWRWTHPRWRQCLTCTAPQNFSNLQNFIWFTKVHQQLIEMTTQSLHNLTKDSTPFMWIEPCDKAFKEIRKVFVSPPLLNITEPYILFVLDCNCLYFSLGAVLSQHCKEDGRLRLAHYLSWYLIQPMRNWNVLDTELVPIIAWFKEWTHHLEGNPNRLEMIVYTYDCDLKSFMNTKKLKQHQPGWADILGFLDFKIRL